MADTAGKLNHEATGHPRFVAAFAAKLWAMSEPREFPRLTCRCGAFLVLLWSVIAGGPAAAAHITDKLVVGVYDAPKVEGTPLSLLSSGTPVEVLERRDGFARVRLADGGEGWIEAEYITEEKPAKAMLLETQARLRQMGIELAALRERQAAAGDASARAADPVPSAREAQLRQALEQAEARISELEQRAAGPAAETDGQLAALQARARQAVALLQQAPGMTAGDVPPAPAETLSGYLLWIVAGGAAIAGFLKFLPFIPQENVEWVLLLLPLHWALLRRMDPRP